MILMRILMATTWLLASASLAGAEYREIEVRDGGAVVGQVRVQGEVPVLPPLVVYKSHEVCGDHVPDDRLVVGEDGVLANVVVYLQGVEVGKAIARDQPVILDNRKCAFDPHVITASVGQTLEIRNDDPILHDAHAHLGARTLFNRAIMHGKTVRTPLRDTGLIHINCNVRHSWMHAWLFVTDNPYHAVTDQDGRFRIDGVPPGDYTVTVWHELAGSRDLPVEVKPGAEAVTDVHLALSPPTKE